MQIENHTIQLKYNKDNTCKIKFHQEKGIAFKKERRKIYIVHTEDIILYIGEANSTIKARFQRACNSFNTYARTGKARGGYKGYKWLNPEYNPNQNLKVIVVIFDENYDTNRTEIEAIEGELVFLIREEFGYWPTCQNEIHFSNSVSANKFAKTVFNQATLKSIK